MKTYLFSFLFLGSLKFLACDMCGNFMGLTPYDNQSQLALVHRYRMFNGYRTYQQRSSFFMPGAYRTMHNPNIVPGDSMVKTSNHSSRDYESFKVFELRGKYFLHPRWEVNFIAPLQQIKTRYDDQKTSTTGLGDPSLFVAYHLIRRLGDYAIRQRLIFGAGIKLPLGNYQAKNENGRRMSLLTQSGTGSYDHFYYINYIISKNRWGLSTNSLLKLNGKNKFGERLAHSYNQVVSLFARLPVKNVVLYPSVLANYEYSRGLYTNGRLDADTGEDLLLMGPGLDVSYQSFVFNVSWQFNAYERVSSHSLSSAGRVVVGVTFNFNQAGYLFKS